MKMQMQRYTIPRHVKTGESSENRLIHTYTINIFYSVKRLLQRAYVAIDVTGVGFKGRWGKDI